MSDRRLGTSRRRGVLDWWRVRASVTFGRRVQPRHWQSWGDRIGHESSHYPGAPPGPGHGVVAVPPSPLADDFFFIAHDDVTGQSRCGEGRAGLGLAGALLGELVMFGSIDIDRREIILREARAPDDALARTVLDELIRNRNVTSVQDWLEYLSRDAHEEVAQRLLRAGQVRATQVRRLVRSRVAYLPVDMNAAAWPAVRLATKLSKRESLTIPDIVLSGLVAATELEMHVFQYDYADVGHYLRQLLPTLPAPLRALLSETEAAVGEAVLRHRR